MPNTKQKGTLTFFFYREGGDFFGCCLELGMIKVNSSLEEVQDDVTGAARGYVETVIKRNLDDSLLNQPLPDEYVKRYRRFLESLSSPQLAVSVDGFFSVIQKPMNDICQMAC